MHEAPATPDPRQVRNPLHGVTLEMVIKRLVEHYGWVALGDMIAVRCFNVDPSLGSSLAFLRKTSWARTKVEKLYLATFHGPESAPGTPTPPTGD